MVNDNHLYILKQGQDTWNQWRKEKPDIKPNLNEANLRGINLSRIDFKNTSLVDAYLSKANLSNALLHNANLNNADLRWTNLSGAILTSANLSKARLINANCTETAFIGTNLLKANLSGANLSKARIHVTNLNRANLFGANLSEAEIFGTHISEADLSSSNLSKTEFQLVDLSEAMLVNANLSGARFLSKDDAEALDIEVTILNGANFSDADLSNADLTGIDINGAKFIGADLSGAILNNANLSGAILNNANLSGAMLNNANLINAHLIETNLERASLTGCSIYGISAWGLKIDHAIQYDLIITRPGEPTITVDNLEVAQFIYLLLNNKKIRDVIDTITKKVVLILGRFKSERKIILNAIREKLREYDFLPVLFDFEKPESRDFIETVSTLAHLARFVIVDVTDAKIVIEEVPHIVRNITVPVKPLLLEDSGNEPTTLYNLRRNHHSLLDTYRYKNLDELLISFKEKIINPAEAKAQELERK